MQPIINLFLNTPKNKILSRFLLPLIMFVLIIVSSYFAWDYFVNQKSVVLIPSQGTTITIGESSGRDLAISKQIAKTSNKKTIHLRSGSYVVIFSGTKDYQEVTKQITINNSTEIKTPSLKYTDKKLSQLLETENSAIQKVISPVMPSSGYIVDAGTLFEKGDWYGTNLKPSDWIYPTMAVQNLGPVSGSKDMLRVILHKTNGQWKVAAGPSIIFSIDDHQSIPADVIKATNQLGFILD